MSVFAVLRWPLLPCETLARSPWRERGGFRAAPRARVRSFNLHTNNDLPLGKEDKNALRKRTKKHRRVKPEPAKCMDGARHSARGKGDGTKALDDQTGSSKAGLHV